MRADDGGSILPPAPTTGPISLHPLTGDASHVLTNGAATALHGWQTELGNLWPQALGFLALVVGIHLFEWWIDYKQRKSQPQQLTLF